MFHPTASPGEPVYLPDAAIHMLREYIATSHTTALKTSTFKHVVAEMEGTIHPKARAARLAIALLDHGLTPECIKGKTPAEVAQGVLDRLVPEPIYKDVESFSLGPVPE